MDAKLKPYALLVHVVSTTQIMLSYSRIIAYFVTRSPFNTHT